MDAGWKGTTKLVALVFWHSVPHDGLHAQLDGSSSRRLARFTVVEPIYGSNYSAVRAVGVDSFAGCSEENSNRSPWVVGCGMVQRSFTGLDLETVAWSNLLVGRELAHCRLRGIATDLSQTPQPYRSAWRSESVISPRINSVIFEQPTDWLPGSAMSAVR